MRRTHRSATSGCVKSHARSLAFRWTLSRVCPAGRDLDGRDPGPFWSRASPHLPHHALRAVPGAGSALSLAGTPSRLGPHHARKPAPTSRSPSGHAGSAALLSCTLPLQGAWRPASGCLPVCPHLPKACGLSKDDGLIIVLFPLQSTVPGT